jgi:hypothetical protein
MRKWLCLEAAPVASPATLSQMRDVIAGVGFALAATSCGGDVSNTPSDGGSSKAMVSESDAGAHPTCTWPAWIESSDGGYPAY